jgi:hypothetical protein
VLTFVTFQQRTEDEAEWQEAGGPYRDAEIGKAENWVGKLKSEMGGQIALSGELNPEESSKYRIATLAGCG